MSGIQVKIRICKINRFISKGVTINFDNDLKECDSDDNSMSDKSSFFQDLLIHSEKKLSLFYSRFFCARLRLYHPA